MKIIRFPDANKTDIVAPTDTIEEVVDKWKCNGNPNIEVTLYAYLPPYFFPSRFDGNPSHNPSDATSSSREVSVLEVKDPSDIFEGREE